MKLCSKCGKEKKLSEFHIDRGKFHSKCKECRNTYERTRNKIIKKKFNSLYGVWHVMKTRCKNPNDKSYRYYGGKGIKVYNEWSNSFISFYKWAIKNGHKKGLQIDRINSNKDYCPKNCRWATVTENARNRRNTVLNITKVKKIRELSKKGKIPQRKIGLIFGIAQGTVSSINRKITWKDV